ncbi:ricin B lectin domain-containing protein [Gloeopeniophorella convolvens]|nr:ricin B lectin domain-containing protein [Gloeopeniophorella convolvens]
MSLTPGLYKLTNAKSGTVFDLSGGDNRSIIGYDYHGGENQKWQLEQQTDGQWLIRSAGSGKYIAFDGEAKDGAPVVAIDESSQRWDIWPEQGVSQGFRHGTKSTPLLTS